MESYGTKKTAADISLEKNLHLLRKINYSYGNCCGSMKIKNQDLSYANKFFGPKFWKLSAHNRLGKCTRNR